MDRLSLHKLSLVNFKNYPFADIVFSNGLNCITGNNGVGKTNLLDAIHYLSFTKSFFNPIDYQNIFHGAPLFVIQGIFKAGTREDEVYCAQKKGERKQFMLNKKEYSRFADHIGLFPVVMISPADSELILEGSEVRRKFADSIISQYDRQYLEDIMAYSRVLLQRNALLKQFSMNKNFNLESLKVWDAQMTEPGKNIFEKRKKFTEEYKPFFQKYYHLLSGGKEQVEITYQSQLNHGDFETLLNEAIDKDRIMEYTTVGIHKDDWEFKTDKFLVKKFASQGQQKTYLLALKLAQFEFVKQHKQIIPVLMLDDIHDKLDEQRTKHLTELISSDEFGQVFITETSKERIQKLFKGKNNEMKIFKAKEGIISEQQ